MIQIEESNPSFESCFDCIHSDDSEEICILRRCIHAVSQLKECYVPKSDDAAKQLNNLIFDINPAEICAQIEADNLKKWCEIIQVEMKMAMVQLPCWGKDGEVE